MDVIDDKPVEERFVLPEKEESFRTRNNDRTVWEKNETYGSSGEPLCISRI